MKVAFYTLGCKVNQYDTQMMSEKFTAAGYTVVGFDELADVYVINTCTVTQVSDKKSRNAISRARRRNPDAVVAVCGCYSQTAPKEAASIEGVDIVIGTRNRADIIYYVNQFLKNGDPIIDVDSISKIGSEKITGFSEKTRAIIKIEDGCRNFCSYCLIPFARGAIVSKPVEQIITEARSVAAAGYREVVLTGIHLSSYGKDLNGVSLEDSVEAVGGLDGIGRIRLGSLEPTVVTESFISRLTRIKKLCPSFHLSLQSGCNKTLKAMNRRYTAEQYASAVSLLRSAFENCAITTDMIVGFPGETDDDFFESAEFAKRIGFAKIHIFPYSKRRGTKAAGMSGQITKQTKQLREKALAEIEKASREDYMRSQIGKTLKVLVERCENDVCNGFSENYLHVCFDGKAELCGSIVSVNIKETAKEGLYGIII